MLQRHKAVVLSVFEDKFYYICKNKIFAFFQIYSKSHLMRLGNTWADPEGTGGQDPPPSIITKIEGFIEILVCIP